MKRLLALLLLAAWPAAAQVDITAAPCSMTDGSCATGGLPAPSLAAAGKVAAVNAGGTAYELISAAGTGTVTSVGISAPSIFSVADSPVTVSGTLALSLATQAPNLVWAGPTTGANAAPTFRALVAADLGNFALAPNLARLTLQDAGGDTTPLTVRASNGGTAAIAQFQDSANGALSYITHEGKYQLLADKGAGKVLTSDANGVGSWSAAAGGITNSAGANVIPKSDGTNLVASSISEASAGALATSAGTALGLTATAPAATTGASQAGVGVTITASPAVASTDTAGAAAGGSVTITAGAAARNASGNANGGDITLATGAGIGTGVAGTVIVPAGSAGRASVGTAGNNGIYFNSGNVYVLSTGTMRSSLGPDGIRTDGTVAGTSIGFSNGFPSNGVDTGFCRRGAANPAWGAAAASPVAYTHSLAADGSGTDITGASAVLQPGAPTGAGASGSLRIKTFVPGSTGTSLSKTTTDRLLIAGTTVALTDATAVTVATVQVPSGTVAGGEVSYTIKVTDGTDHQSLKGRAQWAAVNKGGTVTASISLLGTEAVITSAGTLSNTVTIVPSGNTVLLKLAADTSLSPSAGGFFAYVRAETDGAGATVTVP